MAEASAAAPGAMLLKIFLAPAADEPLRDQPEARGHRVLAEVPAGPNRGGVLVRDDGISQVVTLKLPADQLRGVNRAIELHAWGSFQTEFYQT